MGDVARALEREDKIVGCLRAPGGEALGALQAIECAVDLNGGEVPGGEGELAPAGEARGIESAAPRRIGPAGDADADAACHAPPPGGLRGQPPRPPVGSANARRPMVRSPQARRSGVPIDPPRTFPVPRINRLVMPAHAIRRIVCPDMASPQNGSPRSLSRYLDVARRCPLTFDERERSVGSGECVARFLGGA